MWYIFSTNYEQSSVQYDWGTGVATVNCIYQCWDTTNLVNFGTQVQVPFLFGDTQNQIQSKTKDAIIADLLSRYGVTVTQSDIRLLWA